MREKEQSNLTAPSPRRFTLPKSHMLRGRRNFKRLFSASLLIKSPMVNLRYITFASDSKEFRIGFISPKKLGNAVQRNHCKRLMREAYRLNQHLITDIADSHSRGLHFAMIARTPFMDFDSVKRDTVTLLTELRSRILSNRKDF